MTKVNWGRGTCTRACPTPMLLEDANFPGRRSTTQQALLQRKFTRQHRDSCRNIFFLLKKRIPSGVIADQGEQRQ